MTDAQLIQLWNLLFPDNDSREISEQDLRDGLIAFLNTLSTRIGNLPGLNTYVKTSLVAAINELVSRLGNLEDRFTPQFGNADPNDVPPVINEYGAIYIQQEVAGMSVVDVGYWVYSNVQNVGWINITSLNSVLYTPQNLSLAQKKQALLNLGWIEINGNIFEYRRNPSNMGFAITAGEIAVNGWVSPTRFGKLLIYVSGDPSNSASWNIVDYIDF